jgi:hypothetical protein
LHVLAQSKQESKLVLDANAFLHSSGKSDLLLDANVAASSSGKSQLVLDGDATLNSTTGNTNIIAAIKTALQGGKVSQLDLEAAGATLTSQKTKVNGESMTEIVGPLVKIN